MFKIPTETQYVIDTLTAAGHEAYIVGGCVRDILLMKTPHDFDITTSAAPKEVIGLFEKTVPTGIKHGTVTVIIGGKPIEVTTFRTEGAYTDSRRPDSVRFVSSLKEDLARRDFTVNAMAYNSKSGLQDFFGGKDDLDNKILRAVGEPKKRFSEDALRILRLFRFASVLEFEIENETFVAALADSYMLSNISRERIATELKKSVSGKNFRCFAPLISTGGLDFLKITRLPDFEKTAKFGDNPQLAFFTFLNSSGGSLDEFKPSNEEKNYFLKMEYLLKSAPPSTEAEIKEAMNTVSCKILRDYLNFIGEDTSLLYKVIHSGEPYRISDLELKGDDLAKLGFRGAEIGEKLELLREFVINNPNKNNKDDLIAQIKVTK